MRTHKYYGLALFVTVAACSGKNSGSAGSEGTGVLTIAAAADAEVLIPQLVQSTQGKQVTDMLFDYLAVPAATLETVAMPDSNRRWPVAGHGPTIRCPLHLHSMRERTGTMASQFAPLT